MENLKEIFYEFCEKDSEFRPQFLNPFTQNGKIYATDGHSMIFVDEKDCDFEFMNEHQITSDIEAIIPSEDFSKIIDLSKIDFEKYKTEDEIQTIGKDIDCKYCDGNGEVEWEFEHWAKDFECPACDGTGIESKAKEIKTGNKVFGKYYVKIQDSYFDIRLIYRIFKVKKVLNEEIELLTLSKFNKASLFKIGKAIILLMPCLIYGDENVINESF